MIKVGITGCETLRATELVRVLINHPDVELCWAIGDVPSGVCLDSIVTGIVGECDLKANPEKPLDEVDVVFVCDSVTRAQSTLDALALPEQTRIIDLSGNHNMDHGGESPWKYGLSEMQRRVLVHDSPLVSIPGNAATALLLAVMPMARNLMLNSPLEIKVALGTMAFLEDGRTIDGFDVDGWAANQRQEVEYALRQCQSSFDQPVSLTISRLAERRALAAAVRFKCGVDGETVHQLYDQYYDDHNFVFIVDRPIVTADVENTNKCLIHLEKDERTGWLTIHAVMDLLLKGSAGNAVHIMNLMFGLHERAGLALKATGC